MEEYIGVVDCNRGSIQSSATAASLPLDREHYYVTLEYMCPSGTNNHGAILLSWGTASTHNMNGMSHNHNSGFLNNYWYAEDLRYYYPTHPCDGSWHRITASFDGTTRKLFFDNTLATSDVPGGAAANRNDNFCLGGEASRNTHAFTGSIRNVQVFRDSNTPDSCTATA